MIIMIDMLPHFVMISKCDGIYSVYTYIYIYIYHIDIALTVFTISMDVHIKNLIFKISH